MTWMFGFFLVLLIAASTVALVVHTPPQRLAGAIRLVVPVSLIAIGAVLSLIGRAAIGVPLAVFGLTLWRRNRSVSEMPRGSSQKSTVRSAMFEMELDHETGEMDGTILTGLHEGRRLSSLDRDEVMALFERTRQDGDSAALLEAYLDRRFAGWREDTQSDTNSRHAGPGGSGPMTKEEAYQVLGLAPGAGTQEIRKAHRRLMKRIHPDFGGSTFLASKINEAKDILLG